MKLRQTLPTLLFALAASNASAVVITSETMQLTPLPPMGGGATFETIYTIAAEPGDAPVDSLSIFFEIGLFENLGVVGEPMGWFVDPYEPDPGLGPTPFGDGYFDVYTFSAPILPDSSLGDLVVTYDFLGMGLPGDQYFEIYDFDFNVVASGTTSSGMGAVPEPTTLALFGIGLAGLAVGGRRRQGRSGTKPREIVR